MKVYCITGNMGSGKSVVAKIIETFGYPVYYSDERAKQMYFIPEIKKKITELLGHKVYLSDNEIDTKYIAHKIFSDDKLLKEINKIIHTAIKKDFEKFIEKHKDAPFAFKESALIFEANLKDNCHKIILVTAPQDIRIKRIKKRDNLSEQEILQRMSKQWNDEEKIPHADFVIYNDEKESLLLKVLGVLDKIKNE